jgi:O-antigen/teichoic acid export membrane protein
MDQAASRLRNDMWQPASVSIRAESRMNPGMSSRSNRNAIVFVVARGMSLLVPLLTFPVLGRALGPHGVGMLAYAQAFIQYFAVMVDFGFNLVTIATIAKCRDDPLEVRRIFWSVTLVRTALFMLCTLLVVPLAFWLAHSAQERLVLLLSLMLLTGVLLTPGWLYQGMESAIAFSVLSLLPRLMVFPLLLLFVELPEHIARAALIMYGAEFVAGLCLFGYAWCALAPGKPLFDVEVGKQEAARSVDTWLSIAISTAVTYATPLVLRELAGLGMVGLFSASDRIVRVVHSFFYPVVQAYQARVSRLWSIDASAAKAMVRKVTAMLLAVGLVFCVGMQFFAENVLVLLFGAEFASGSAVLRTGALFPIFSAASLTAFYFLYLASGQGRAVMSVYVVSGLIHVAMLFPLIHRYGATGAAMTVVVSEALLTIMLWYRTRHVWALR